MEKYGFGAKPSKIDVRDYRLKRAAARIFPNTFELEMPEVKYQGVVGSCVAHSLSIVVEYYSRLQGDENREFSVGYIYGNRSIDNDEGVGMCTRNAIKTVCEYGDVVKTLFPENLEVPTIIEKFQENRDFLFPKGYPFRFSGYYACYTEDDIKAALMKGSPVVFAIPWYNDIELDEEYVVHSKEDRNDIYAHHCMVIYGWNEKGWKFQNSWGTNWGNGGRAILPYDFTIREAYGIIDDISENQKQKHIHALEHSNRQLQLTVEELTNKLEELFGEIEKLTNSSISDSQKLKQASDTIDLLNRQIENYKAIIAQQEASLVEAQNELIELKKPFQSGIGKVIAKVANFFLNLFKKR